MENELDLVSLLMIQLQTVTKQIFQANGVFYHSEWIILSHLQLSQRRDKIALE